MSFSPTMVTLVWGGWGCGGLGSIKPFGCSFELEHHGLLSLHREAEPPRVRCAGKKAAAVHIILPLHSITAQTPCPHSTGPRLSKTHSSVCVCVCVCVCVLVWYSPTDSREKLGNHHLSPTDMSFASASAPQHCPSLCPPRHRRRLPPMGVSGGQSAAAPANFTGLEAVVRAFAAASRHGVRASPKGVMRYSTVRHAAHRHPKGGPLGAHPPHLMRMLYADLCHKGRRLQSNKIITKSSSVALR